MIIGGELLVICIRVTRPDWTEVKRPKGHPARSQGPESPEGPLTSSPYNPTDEEATDEEATNEEATDEEETD